MKTGEGAEDIYFAREHLIALLKIVPPKYRMVHYLLGMAVAEIDDLTRKVCTCEGGNHDETSAPLQVRG